MVSRVMVVVNSARLGNRAPSGLVGRQLRRRGIRRRGGTSFIPIGFASITRIGGAISTITIIGARRDGGGSITRLGRQNHPDWWGDFDDQRIWWPAGWWWQNRPDWVRENHPDWWGDFDDRIMWRPAS